MYTLNLSPIWTFKLFVSLCWQCSTNNLVKAQNGQLCAEVPLNPINQLWRFSITITIHIFSIVDCLAGYWQIFLTLCPIWWCERYLCMACCVISIRGKMSWPTYHEHWTLHLAVILSTILNSFGFDCVMDSWCVDSTRPCRCGNIKPNLAIIFGILYGFIVAPCHCPKKCNQLHGMVIATTVLWMLCSGVVGKEIHMTSSTLQCETLIHLCCSLECLWVP